MFTIIECITVALAIWGAIDYAKCRIQIRKILKDYIGKNPTLRIEIRKIRKDYIRRNPTLRNNIRMIWDSTYHKWNLIIHVAIVVTGLMVIVSAYLHKL